MSPLIAPVEPSEQETGTPRNFIEVTFLMAPSRFFAPTLTVESGIPLTLPSSLSLAALAVAGSAKATTSAAQAPILRIDIDPPSFSVPGLTTLADNTGGRPAMRTAGPTIRTQKPWRARRGHH
jgi:hypothetical protein